MEKSSTGESSLECNSSEKEVAGEISQSKGEKKFVQKKTLLKCLKLVRKKPMTLNKGLKPNSLEFSMNENQNSAKASASAANMKSVKNRKLVRKKPTALADSVKPVLLAHILDKSEVPSISTISPQNIKLSESTKLIQTNTNSMPNKSPNTNSLANCANVNRNSTKEKISAINIKSAENANLERKKLTTMDKSLKTSSVVHSLNGNKNAIKETNVKEPLRGPLRIMQLNNSNQITNNGKSNSTEQLEKGIEDDRLSFSKKLVRNYCNI